MQSSFDDKQLLSIGEASEYLGVSIDTLRRWEKKKRIEPYRSPGGHRYFKKDDLDRLFGKRYLRDEPTQRTTGAYKDDLSENLKEPGSTNPPQPSPQQTPSMSANYFPQGYNTPQFSEQSNFRTNPSLPAWRKVDVSQEQHTSPTFIEPYTSNTIIRETENFVRQVQIPDMSPIRVSENNYNNSNTQESTAYYQEKTEVVRQQPLDSYQEKNNSLSPHEAYLNQQKVSVLTPPIIIKEEATKPLELNIPPVSFPPSFMTRNNKAPEEKIAIDKDMLVYISLGVGVLLLLVTLFIIWRNSQNVLSPVP